jgi:hypothetical protein
LIILSSPYSQAGALFELHRKHYGRDESNVLIWQASAPEMNPTLPSDYLQRMEQDDPEAFRSEVLGEFRAGLSLLLDPETVADCVDVGVRERLPDENLQYMAFCDPSGGRRDKFAVAIAHREESGRTVLDALRSWDPPFDPASVVAEAARFVKSYRVYEVTGDRYAAEFVVSAWREQGCRYQASERDRSTIYLDLLPLVNAQQCSLLDHQGLLRELNGLVRRRGASGKDRVDHPQAGHDDLANAAAGALVLAAQRVPKVRVREALWG